MVSIRIGVRKGDNVNTAWNSVRLRAHLAGDPTRRRSDDTRPLADLVALRRSSPAGIGPDPRTELDKIEWIDIGSGKRIMRGEVTVSLFKEIMEGYEIKGHNADKLKAYLADSSKTDAALGFASLKDAREFAKRLSEQTGRQFKVQTEAEWLAAEDSLAGTNLTWTETEIEKGSGYYLLRRLNDLNQHRDFSMNRYFYAIRLVEDLPNQQVGQ